ncbi:photosystem reaction center subunit H [Camelimonas fluminis]|nr:photosystem reaction center subunit H [Camelimonas fluminis]
MNKLAGSVAVMLMAAGAFSGASLAQTAPTPTTKPIFLTVEEGPAVYSSLKGLNVKNAGDETVGEISDVVIDGHNVNAYILSVGGFLGAGTHYVAVAPTALTVTWNDSDKKWNARINATKEQLKAAPQFRYEGRFAK